MLLVDGSGLPLAIDVDSASPAEVTLIEPLLNQAVTQSVPQRLIYDRAADSDALRERLAARGIELICPHRKRPRPAGNTGWPSIAPLPQAVDYRTHDQLAPGLPKAGYSTRVLRVPL